MNVLTGGAMKLLTFTLMIVFSILVLAIGTPNLEQSRQESRCAHAFIQAQQIKAGTLPLDTVDPWGMPFENSKDAEGRLVVTSLGANMSTVTNGFDDDDVSSDMSFPPHKMMLRSKQRQLLSTLILSGSPWLLRSIRFFGSQLLRLRPTVRDINSSPSIRTTV